jgi:hypothetical protein
MGFVSLRHMRERRSTSRGFCLPAVFHPQGLTTLPAASSLRTPVGSVSPRRRPWDLPFGAFPSRKVSRRFPLEAPTYRFSHERRLSRWEKHHSSDRGSWASTLPRVPGRRTDVSGTPTGCSLGFPPSRVSCQKPYPGFRPAFLSRAWRSTTRPALPAPQSIDQPLTRLTSSTKNAAG